MARRRKKHLTVQDIGSLKTTPVQRIDGHITTLREWTRLENQKAEAVKQAEAEKRQEPVRKSELLLAQAAAEQTARLKKVWSQSCEKLQEFPIEVIPVDHFGDFPVSETGDDAVAVGAAIRAFRAQYPGLTDDDVSKLRAYLEVLRLNRNVTMSSLKSWDLGLERLVNIGAMTVAGYEPPVAPTREPERAPFKQTIDELLASTSAETREGRAILVAAVTEDVISEFNQCWQAFTESLYRNFNGFVLSETQRQHFYNTMVRRNLSFNRPKDYDAVRRALVAAGELPSHLVYEFEKIDAEMESADLSNMEVRREFARRSRQLQ
jgi:hypothetical protein